MKQLNYVELMEQAEACSSRKDAIKLINMATDIREQSQSTSRLIRFSTNSE